MRDAAPRRQVPAGDDHVDERRELGPDRRLPAPDVRRREAAERQREPDEQRAATAPGHARSEPAGRTTVIGPARRGTGRAERVRRGPSSGPEDRRKDGPMGPARRRRRPTAQRRPRRVGPRLARELERLGPEVRARELEHEAGSAGARGRGQPPAVAPRRCGRRSPARGRARPRRAPGRRAMRRLTGSGRPGPASLTSTRTRPPTSRARTSTGAAPCSTAFATRLPHACARRTGSARTSARPRSGSDRQRRAERRRERPPGLGAVVQERADVDELGSRARPPAARCRDEILERERRPAQLEIDAAAARSASSRPCSPSRAAHSGPRSSWPASATSSACRTSRARSADAPQPRHSAVIQPAYATALTPPPPPARPRAGSRRPTR